MEEALFRINEVAKLHSISKKTLQYYDKIGLFKPHYIDDQSGYRYYNRLQFPFLKQIIYLKNIGFNLDEIQTMLDNRTFDVMIDFLEKKLQQTQSEVDVLTHNLQAIQYLIQAYQRNQCIDERDLYTPSIMICPEKRVVSEPCSVPANRLSVMLAYRKVLAKLRTLNIFSQMDYGTLYYQEGLENRDFSYHAGSFITIPEFFEISDFTLLPAGKYAFMYKKGGYYDEKSLNIFLDWLAGKGYILDGPVFDYCVVDYTFTNSEDDMIQQLVVKIK